MSTNYEAIDCLDNLLTNRTPIVYCPYQEFIKLLQDRGQYFGKMPPFLVMIIMWRMKNSDVCE
jgi:hypothetical protein